MTSATKLTSLTYRSLTYREAKANADKITAGKNILPVLSEFLAAHCLGTPGFVVKTKPGVGGKRRLGPRSPASRTTGPHLADFADFSFSVLYRAYIVDIGVYLAYRVYRVHRAVYRVYRAYIAYIACISHISRAYRGYRSYIAYIACISRISRVYRSSF